MEPSEKPGHEAALEEAIRRGARAPYDERRASERRVAPLAVQQLALVTRLAADADVHVRRTTVEIMRRGAGPEERIAALLLERLSAEPDVKTRRRICVALGESGRLSIAGDLVRRLDTEEHRYVQVSLILALGRLGFSTWPSRWIEHARSGAPGPVRDALRRVGAGLGAAPARRTVRRARPPGRYLLRTYLGAERLSRLETERGKLATDVLAPGWLRVDAAHDDAAQRIGRLRAHLADYHVVAELAPSAEDLERSLLDACRRVAELRGVGPETAFRVMMPRTESRSRQRKTMAGFADRISRELGWRADRSHWDIELWILPFGDHRRIVWRDRGWPTVRQSGDREVVPASLHPSVAAALCLLALEGCEAPEGSQPTLLDPCCGAGTILSEWLALCPAARAIGSDRSVKALALARRNLARIASRSALHRADIGSLPLRAGSVDCAIANLPFGLRAKHEESNSVLYTRFVREAARVVRPSGRIVAYSADQSALAEAYKASGFGRLGPTATIHAGGLDVFVYCAGRPTS